MSKSEKAIQAEVMLQASRDGWLLWRNNTGVALRQDGVPVRYGLANVSHKMNQVIKSSDLIGIRPVLITKEMVGRTLGQFVAIETKKEDWQYTGNDHEAAQKNFIDQILLKGGYAYFVNGKLI